MKIRGVNVNMMEFVNVQLLKGSVGGYGVGDTFKCDKETAQVLERFGIVKFMPEREIKIEPIKPGRVRKIDF